MEPKKPYAIHGESPAPEYEGDDPIAREVRERELLMRDALSGPLGHGPYALEMEIGPRNEASYQRELERQAQVRAAMGGVPDPTCEATDAPEPRLPYALKR